jgi:hypothetical protein
MYHFDHSSKGDRLENEEKDEKVSTDCLYITSVEAIFVKDEVKLNADPAIYVLLVSSTSAWKRLSQ